MRNIQFSLCSIRIFFSFFLSSFLSFSIGIFFDKHKRFTGLQGRERELLFFLFTTSTHSWHSFSSSWFLPLLFNRSICNYQTDSWWELFSLEIFILFTFSMMQVSWSYWLWHFKVPFVSIGAHIKLLPFYCKANTLTNWNP